MEKRLKNKIEREINPIEIYLNLIDAYRNKVKEIGKIKKRFPKITGSSEIETSRLVIDKERHEIHLKLIELGKQLGKNSNDVLVDIVRRDGTLDEYGLPEFSILTENDIIDTGEWHNPYDFNIDTDRMTPSDKTISDHIENEGTSLIDPNEVMIVFAIVPIVNGTELDPEDYEERVKRANALATEINGRIFEECDSSYHEAYAKILGVTIPKKDLEKVAVIIKSNSDKYRLGKEFYPDTIKR